MATWRRKRRAPRWGGFIEYSWNAYEENEKMAVSGGVTTAYRCQVSGNELTVQTTSMLKSECANVEAALAILARGEQCTVASADVPILRMRLRAEGIRA